jgi:hypothetical protein
VFIIAYFRLKHNRKIFRISAFSAVERLSKLQDRIFELCDRTRWYKAASQFLELEAEVKAELKSGEKDAILLNAKRAVRFTGCKSSFGVTARFYFIYLGAMSVYVFCWR